MIYVMSDLHGCYEEYKEMLEKIAFHEDDLLFVLGDVVDRGEKSMELLLDMKAKENIIPIMGNHDYMALTILKKLFVEITEANVDSHLTSEDMMNYYHWSQDGGDKTIKAFQALPRSTQKEILSYLETFSDFEEVCVNQEEYVLVHAGLSSFEETKDLYDYRLDELIFTALDFNKQYYQDKTIVCGHTPTFLIDENYKGVIYKNKGTIAIDCGVVFGGRLACLCLDTKEEFYVSKKV